jgi:hypothetical protein
VTSDLLSPKYSVQRLVLLDEAADAFLSTAAQTRKWKALEPALGRFEKSVAAAFLEQGARFVSLLAQNRALIELSEAEAEPWEPLFDSVSMESLNAIPTSDLTEAQALGQMVAYGQFGLDTNFQLDNPRATQYLASQSASLITGIDNTTRESLRSTFATARVDGWSYDKLAGELLKQYSHWSTPQPQQHIKSRAHLIAVNEIAHAYESGNADVAMHLQGRGLAMVKRWLAGVPAKADALCRANVDMGWIPMDQPFLHGAQHAPAHPACRCTTEYQRANKQCGCPAVKSNVIQMLEAGPTLAQVSSYLGVSTGTLNKVKNYIGYTPGTYGSWSDAYTQYKTKSIPAPTTTVKSYGIPTASTASPTSYTQSVAPAAPVSTVVTPSVKTTTQIMSSVGKSFEEVYAAVKTGSIQGKYDVQQGTYLIDENAAKSYFNSPTYSKKTLATKYYSQFGNDPVKIAQVAQVLKDPSGFVKASAPAPIPTKVPAPIAAPVSLPKVKALTAYKNLGLTPQQFQQLKKKGLQVDANGMVDPIQLQQMASGFKKKAAGHAFMANQVAPTPCAQPTAINANTPFGKISVSEAERMWDPKPAHGFQSLRAYTGSAYASINRKLRHNQVTYGSEASINKHISAIDRAMASHVVPRNIVVFRGDSESMIGLPKTKTGYAGGKVQYTGGPTQAQIQKQIGSIQQDLGYMSTSVTHGFGGRVQMELEVPAGTPGYYVGQISQHKGENELLLSRGMRYVITDIQVVQGAYGIGGDMLKVKARVVP